MPKYIFTIANDHEDWNKQPQKLPDHQSAKCAAIRMVADTLCKHPEAFWDDDPHQVTVSDETMMTLFVVDIMTVTSPAVPVLARKGSA